MTRRRRLLRAMCGLTAAALAGGLCPAYPIVTRGESWGGALLDLGMRWHLAGSRSLAYDVQLTPGELRPAAVLPAATQEGTSPPMPKAAKPKPKKSQAAAELGKLGGQARAKNLTERQRVEAATAAANARWGKGAKRG